MLSIVFVAALSTSAQVPDGWTCEDALFADGTCDCGCGALDVDDCGESLEFTNCERSGCPAGQAPWEHENPSCMGSTCGDGWKADDEACDDFDALASGGCNADCSAVNDGYDCGIGAQGCEEVAEGEGEGDEGEGDEGEGDEGEGDEDGDDDGDGGGCAATPAAPIGALASLLFALRRRR